MKIVKINSKWKFIVLLSLFLFLSLSLCRSRLDSACWLYNLLPQISTFWRVLSTSRSNSDEFSILLRPENIASVGHGISLPTFKDKAGIASGGWVKKSHGKVTFLDILDEELFFSKLSDWRTTKIPVSVQTLFSYYIKLKKTVCVIAKPFYFKMNSIKIYLNAIAFEDFTYKIIDHYRE